MRFQTYWVLVVLTLLAGCVNQNKTATLEDLYTRDVKLPDGSKFRAEVVTSKFDMSRGMMFRDKLDSDRGMLFIHGEPGLFPYWMYQVRIPLDLIWMDQNRLITQIVPNAEPCKSESAAKCPQYGGSRRSLFVLELNAGMAEKHKLKLGDRLDF
ncbi:MAG: DUF192 domain-containing protein [Bryobacterales bacterium]|nr:DUF192 domain-containing protein [Bryobacterales bacterium]